MLNLRLRDIILSIDDVEASLPSRVATLLRLEKERLHDFKVVRRAVDARRKSQIRRVYTVEFSLTDDDFLRRHGNCKGKLEEVKPIVVPQPLTARRSKTATVVGMGPAGLFAALHLARCGLHVILLEQGEPLEKRVKDVLSFWNGGTLLGHSNVQFGEGWAGTFSDGKLTTRVNHPWSRLILQTLVDFGAPHEILIEARPHIGTDLLRQVLLRFRQELERLGVVIRFRSRCSELMLRQKRVVGVRLPNGEELCADYLLFAPGHSARASYAMLAASGVAMERKPFAMGCESSILRP